jgi:hypothetical protein
MADLLSHARIDQSAHPLVGAGTGEEKVTTLLAAFSLADAGPARETVAAARARVTASARRVRTDMLVLPE